MTKTRRPAAFRIAHEAPREPDPQTPREDRTSRRRPRAQDATLAVPDPVDVFEMEAELDPPPPVPPRRRSRLGAIFLAATAALISLGVGLWVDGLIRELFARSDWLGWAAAGLAAIAAVCLAAIVVREIAALRRLSSVEAIRRHAADAVARDDLKAARAVVAELSAFTSGRAETAAGRRALADLRGEVMDGADLIRLAESEILAPLDERAKMLVLDAAKRVSVVTAVSPRALVDLAYVLFEASRLIRRLAELYGGRPGTLGFFRLARNVLAHLAVTGSIAAGDSLVQQLVGHGLAARLSAKLGEGVVNGMMTVRIGIAAIEAARPLPFVGLRRPGVGDFLAALTAFATRKAPE